MITLVFVIKNIIQKQNEEILNIVYFYLFYLLHKTLLVVFSNINFIFQNLYRDIEFSSEDIIYTIKFCKSRYIVHTYID